MKMTIDAKNKKLGRLASEIAVILMGKDDPSFSREKVANRQVEVLNASQMDIDEKKSQTKKYKSYSGYPGGLKEETLKNLSGRKGSSEALKIAVFGMLPKNKLRSRMIKNLIIKE